MVTSDFIKIKHNILAFATIGGILYLYSAIDYYKLEKNLEYTPIHYYGVDGFFFSIVLGVFAYHYYKYNDYPIFRIIGYSMVFSILIILSIGYIEKIEGSKNAFFVLNAFLSIMFFMGIGAINGIFSKWILIVNLAILIITIFSDRVVTPIMWTTLLYLIEIKDPYIQWGILIFSSIMTVYPKDGVSFFNID